MKLAIALLIGFAALLGFIKVKNELQMTAEYSRQADAQERIAEALEGIAR